MLLLNDAALIKSFLLLLDKSLLDPTPVVARTVSIAVSTMSLFDVDSFKICLPTESLANPFNILPVKSTGNSSIKSSLPFSLTKSFTLS